MKKLNELIKIIHKIKSCHKLDRQEKTKIFVLLLFLASALFEIGLAISNINVPVISDLDYKLLEMNLLLYVISLITLLSLD